MKNQQIIKSTLLLGGAIGFNILFWNENLGINLLIFSVFLLLLGFVFYPSAKYSKPAVSVALGVLVTAAMVMYHNSLVAKFTNITSMIVFVGFLNQTELKAIFHAIPTAVWNFISTPLAILSSINIFSYSEEASKKQLRTFKVIVMPVLFFFVFYLIFYFSNPIFASYSNDFWRTIGDWFSHLFKHISMAWILLFLFGIGIVGWVLFQSDLPYFLKIEKGLPNTLLRKEMKSEKNRTRLKFAHLDLKNEYRSALYLIVSINILLLIINVIDINWLWFNFEYDQSMNLSKYVHEGTYLLILSILMSIGILLYFFRKNLNFYFKNRTLKSVATIWIVQNVILVISVAIRNYQYIYYFGLAYKRIGVIIFLTATIIGLITLFIKIDKRKSSFYLLNMNSWCVYALLIIMSTVNWDNVIVRHNIKYTNDSHMDVKFLLSLSDKVLPVIYEHRSELELYDHYTRSYHNTAEDYLDFRIRLFKKRMANTSWKSWNYADQQALAQLKKLGK